MEGSHSSLIFFRKVILTLGSPVVTICTTRFNIKFLRCPQSVCMYFVWISVQTASISLYSTYLLTYSTVRSPSWEANRFAASQEIPRISRNPKVHYRTHKSPPPVSILGQPNPLHIPTSYLLEIHPNIIHPSTSRSPQWSLSLRLPHQGRGRNVADD